MSLLTLDQVTDTIGSYVDPKPIERRNEDVNGAIFHWGLEQRTKEWYNLRKGKKTASKGALLMVSALTATGKQRAGSVGTLAPGCVTYCDEIATHYDAEELDDSFFSGGTYWMGRGRDLEPEAFEHFIRETGKDAIIVGFVSKGNEGASPDAVILKDQEGVELKCPSPAKHRKYYRNNEELIKDHAYQCHFSMMVTGYKRWHLVSYHPAMRYKMIHLIIERDENIIAHMKSQCKAMDAYIESQLKEG